MFSSSRITPHTIEQSTPAKDLKEVQFKLAEQDAQLSYTDNYIVLKFRETPFSTEELSALAKIVNVAFSSRFEFPLQATCNADQIEFKADRQARPQPLFLKFSLLTIRDELINITNDQEERILTNFDTALSFIRRQVAKNKITNQMLSNFNATVLMSKERDIAHKFVGKVIKKLLQEKPEVLLAFKNIDDVINSSITDTLETLADHIETNNLCIFKNSQELKSFFLNVSNAKDSAFYIPKTKDDPEGQFSLAYAVLLNVLDELLKLDLIETIHQEQIIQFAEEAYQETRLDLTTH